MRKITLVLLVFMPFLVLAQTGPAGIGNNQGSSSLELWLKADKGVLNASAAAISDGESVETWQDQSGNSRNATQTTVSNQPTWTEDGLNGSPILSFEAGNEDHMDFPELTFTDDATLFVIARARELEFQQGFFLGHETSNGKLGVWDKTNGNDQRYFIRGFHSPGNAVYDDSQVFASLTSPFMLYMDKNPSDTYRLIIDGGTPADLFGGTAYTEDMEFDKIGAANGGDGFSWDGDMVEVIMFSEQINVAQRGLIENYLASKYGITIGNDLYIHQSSHSYDVAGIGQSGADTHLSAYSDNILGISTPSDINDGEWMLYGHNNGDATAWTTNEQINSDPNLERIAKEWRVDKTGDLGTVTIHIDPTDLPSFNPDFAFYSLWVDVDGDFTNGAVQYPLTNNAGIYEAYTVDIPDGAFITIAAYKPEIQFTTSSSAGDEEGISNPTFEISITYAVDADFDVNYTFSDGTASSPTHYNYTDATATILAGSTSINISTDGIAPDVTEDGDQDFSITLSSPEFGILGTNSVHNYTINDNDNAESRTIEFDAPFSYNYKKRISIDNSKVSGASDLDDFTVLIALNTGSADTDFAGKVLSNSGFDVKFTLANSVTFLDHELEYYNDATGEYIAWVRIPGLSFDEDTEIDMYYGNAAITVDPSSENTWVDYHGVYHLGEGDFGDGTGQYDGVESNDTSEPTDILGKIGYGKDFDGINDVIELGASFPNLGVSGNEAFTVSLWMNTDNNGNNGRLFCDDDGGNGWAISFGDASAGQLRTFSRNFASAGVIDADGFTASNNTWYYVTLVVDRNNQDRIIYLDGASNISDLSDIGTWGTNNNLTSIGGEPRTSGETLSFSGIIDEVRITQGIRSADWIATEYANQNDPSTFYTVGTEEIVNGLEISESTDILTITVSISNTDDDNPTTVYYATTGGTATSGTDYTAIASTQLSIAAGASNITFDLDLTNDLLNEANETIVLTLTNPGNADLGSNNEITIILIDDDTAPSVEFSLETTTINEGTGSFEIPVQLSAVSGQDIIVNYTVASLLNATENVDYILSTPGTITIPADSLTANIIANIIDDSEIEVDSETFTITITGSTDASLGTKTINTISISDNDNLGIDGPGGVGFKDGSGILTMWYMADSATVSGGKVTGIKNLVGISDYDMVTPAADPDFIDYVGQGTLNGHAEISFNNVEDVLATNSTLSASTFVYNEATSFIVTSHDNMSQQANTYGTSTSQTGGQAVNRFGSHLPWNNTWYFDIGTHNDGGRLSAAYQPAWVGTYGIFTYRADASDDGSTGTKTAWRNNTQIGTAAGTSQFINHTSNYFTLGQSQGTDFQGNIVEFLLYTAPVNEPQRIIINNYLAVKYGLSIADDYYVWEASHSFEVAGIGKTNDEAHTAAKTGAITISAASDLENDEYLLFGHDNGDKDSWTTTNIPTGDILRLDKEWKFDMTGDVGTISIAIDPTLVIAKQSGYEDFIILTDADGDFTSGAKVHATSLLDGKYIANNISIAKGEYLAIGMIKRSVQFLTTSLNQPENSQGLVTLELDYTSGETIVIDYTITGSATQGVDFSLAASGSATILAGSSTMAIDLGIIDESLKEGDETIIITLDNITAGNSIGTNSVFTYTITDDDNSREVFFNDACEFGYSKTITISSALVSGSADLINFPFLVNISGDNDLKTTANSGHVENANGYDIYFRYQDTTFWFDQDIEYFNATTGDLVTWILIPELKFDEDTEIEMFYGNPGITLNPSSEKVWDEYLGVWHLNGDELDASSNDYHGTKNGTTSVGARFGNGTDFNGNNDFIELASFPDLQQDFSISAWVNVDDLSAGQRVFIDDDNNSNGYALSVGDPGSGRVRFYSRGASPTSVDGDGGHAVSVGTWAYVTGVADFDANGSRVIYVDGEEAANETHTNQMGTDVGSTAIGGETLSGEQNNRFTGIMDEVRVYNGLLSEHRVKTEYNNQMEGSGFYAVSTEIVGLGCQIAEADGTISIQVSINPFDNVSETTAIFTATSGNAVNGEDYTLASGTVTIPIGSNSASFDLDITNDLQDEVDETVTITISNPSSNAKIGSNSTITYTILDDDDLPEVQFVDVTSSVNEGSATVTIGVELSAESGNDVTVAFAVSGGASPLATANVDYIVPATTPVNTLTIAAGELSGNIALSIIDDADLEVLEDITIDISSPGNATLGTNTNHVMTINDNDDLGYNGPGGVGEIDGSKTLELWIAADSAAATGGNVTAWNNDIISVVGLDFAPVGTAPTLVENAVNGHAEISFEDVDDVLVSSNTLSTSTFPYNESTFFIVTRTDNLAQGSNAYSTATAANGALSGTNITADIPDGGGLINFDHAGRVLSATYDNAWINGEHSIFGHRVTSDTSVVWRNNQVEIQSGTNSNNFTNHSNFNFYLGRTETDNFQGDIAEIIMFTRPIFDTQADIIQNYLAAKYGLVIENDKYVFDNTHGNEVAGIGQTFSTDQHVAAEAGVITISNASTLDNGDFVLFGHDNASIDSWATSDTPDADSIRRVAREWRFNLTGTPGTITIALDADELPELITGYQDYVVFVDADGDFSAGTDVYQTTLVDGQYKASEVPIVSGDYVSIGIIMRTIEFALSNSNASETNSLNIDVNMNYPYTSDISFDYNITGGTATGSNDDYSAAATDNLTILAGQTSASIPLGVNNDGTVETDETIIMELANAPTGFRFGDNSEHTYTINDDDNDKTILFDIASSSGDESVTDITLTIELRNQDESSLTTDGVNETIAYLSVTGGTAEESPSPDYTLIADTVRIATGTSTVTFDFTVLDDVLDELDETIEISLSSPGNANLGSNSVYTYTIEDNETEVNVEFQDATTTIDEGGSIAAIVVELSNPSGQDIVVDYIVSGGTATSGGIDFALANGSTTIPTGSQITTINVALTDDSEEEVAETIIIDITGATGATFTGQLQHTIILVDNDADYGYYGPGGVGSNESNKLWLDANNINGSGVAGPADGASVNTWVDRSGNGYDFDATGNAPTYNELGMNNNPTVSISGAQGGFSAPTAFNSSLSNYSFVAVYDQTAGSYLAETNTTAQGDFRLDQGTSYLYHLNGADNLATTPSTNEDIMTWVFDSEATNKAEVRRDGVALASDANFSVMGLDNNFSIGNRHSETTVSDSDFEGNISEFIIFNKPLNATQQNIVENYLSSKFDIAIASDLYSFDGTYGYDVIGIGQEAIDDQHIQSMSDSLLMISGASDLNDSEYVFTGHDNGDKLSWTTTEAPNAGVSTRRISREWRTDITGTPGTIIIKIDTTQLPTPPNGYDQYLVWTDDDGDFRTGATTYQLEYSPTFGFHVTDPVTIAAGTFISIGVSQPVIQFSLASSDGAEDDTNPVIEVSLNFSLGEDVTINYAATGGTAANNNDDYLLTSGTLTLTAGQTSANIIPGIIDDGVEESDETITIALTTPSSNVSLGSISEHTYTIHDNDYPRDLEFQTPFVANADEATSTYTVTVEIDVQDAVDATTIDIESELTGTYAEEGTDYTISPTTVSIPANSSSATFDITITDDAVFENDETITLNLSNPSNANIGTNAQFVYTINDNDAAAAPDVEFTDASSSADETVGTANIEVELSEVSVNDVTVSYTVSASTATDGSDYTLADGTLTITAGDMSDNILVTIVDDVLIESSETITIDISSPVNANLTSNTQHVLSISDDDADAGTGPAGIGNANNNLLWLRGENFESVSAGVWTDISGNNNDMTEGGTAQVTGTVEGSTAVSFNGSQFLTTTGATESSASDFDIFFVLNSNINTNAGQTLIDSDNLDIRLDDGTNGAFSDENGVAPNIYDIDANEASIIQFNLEGGSNLADISLYNNSVNTTVTTTYDASDLTGTKSLGAGSNGFDGDIAEVIVFNQAINEAQKIILLNYLSTTYSNLDIGGNDKYAFEVDGFDNNLIGIGREGINDLHVAATTEDFLTISNPNDLNDGEYLMVANDGTDNLSWVTTEVPDGSTWRLTREWKYDMTGDVGTISIEFDTTALPTPPEDYLSWTILISNDSDFTSVDRTYSLATTTGDYVGADNIVIVNGDYMTIALVKNQTLTSGNWTDGSTWSTGKVPKKNETVKLNGGHTVVLDASSEVGAIRIENTAVLDLSGNTITFNNGCIEFEGTADKTNVTYAGSTIIYESNQDQCISALDYANVELNSSGLKYLLGNIIVDGNIEIENSSVTLDVTSNNYGITLEGNWTSSGTFDARAGTVALEGVNTQSISTSGGETFYNLTVDKTGGSVNLGSDVSVENTLTMTEENIILGLNDLNILNGGSFSGGDATSYIIADNVGVLRHAITALSTTYTFPIGDSDEYSPFQFTLNTGTLSSSSITINMRDTKHTNIIEDDYITRYWSLNNEGITGTLDYDVAYFYQEVDVEGVEADILARKFSGSGDAIGGAVNAGSNMLSYPGHTS
ncbi:MAG: DUF2341 domain-containing protein, partial [Reichenbachiella sp.]